MVSEIQSIKFTHITAPGTRLGRMAAPPARSAKTRGDGVDLKRLHRVHVKSLIAVLETLLPSDHRSSPKRNGAGSRSLGKRGRSLTDVLADTAQYVRKLRAAGTAGTVGASARPRASESAPLRARGQVSSPDTPDPASPSSSASPSLLTRGLPPAIDDADLREMIRSSHEILCIEVEMGGGWAISSEGQCGRSMWACAPWGGSSAGVRLASVIDNQDFPELVALWQRSFGALHHHAASSSDYSAGGHPLRDSVVIRVASFTHVQVGGTLLSMRKFEPFEVRMVPVVNGLSGAPCRALIFGTRCRPGEMLPPGVEGVVMRCMETLFQPSPHHHTLANPQPPPSLDPLFLSLSAHSGTYRPTRQHARRGYSWELRTVDSFEAIIRR